MTGITTKALIASPSREWPEPPFEDLISRQAMKLLDMNWLFRDVHEWEDKSIVEIVEVVNIVTEILAPAMFACYGPSIRTELVLRVREIIEIIADPISRERFVWFVSHRLSGVWDAEGTKHREYYFMIPKLKAEELAGGIIDRLDFLYRSELGAYCYTTYLSWKPGDEVRHPVDRP